ncbi:hypothetical protein [Picosynechococcus sp. NKBG15041c]|uniref:hypothetical protein n=1 Tax=Picosynechococcus sp. NKBG15041c TaxID=1407650 RepID=UPI00046439DF|nr:hypothetical protein [Picosynechococcus sp. NKBG15041c]
MGKPSTNPNPPPEISAVSLPCHFQLAQTIYSWHGPQDIILQGEIHGSVATPTAAGILTVSLRDPESATVVATETQAIALGSFPQSFVQSITPPALGQALVLLGELTLNSQTGELLGAQTFSLVADYQAIAARLEPQETATLSSPNPVTPSKPLKLPIPEVSATPRKPAPAEPSILPPKLKSPGKKTSPGLDLPNFVSAPSPVPEPPGEAIAPEMSDPPSLTEQPEVPQAPESPDLPTRPGSFLDDLPEPTAPPESPGESLDPDPAADLDWNSRFFTRLNALVSEGNDSHWLVSHPPAPPKPMEIEAAKETELSSEAPTAETDMAKTKAGAAPTPGAKPFPRLEIVVDSLWDEIMESPEVVSDNGERPEVLELSSPEASAPTESENKPDFSIVPEPQLLLDKANYQVGEIARVQVTLPSAGDRLYVKLWLRDRQTRELLAGPFQLTDFTPKLGGQFQGQQMLPLPPGTLEVRFEAIAIDPRSQQESRRATFDCRVLPDLAADTIDWQALEAED